jgi:hypothetical protein
LPVLLLSKTCQKEILIQTFMYHLLKILYPASFIVEQNLSETLFLFIHILY